jgi:hypothetical protein
MQRFGTGFGFKKTIVLKQRLEIKFLDMSNDYFL